MHAIEGSTSVPAFLTKLWRLVEDAKTNDLISWTQSGRSFLIQNQAEFARDLLPQYYKHSNMASFVRQLNMYGFHKVVSADSGGLKVERDEMEFAHPHFQRGQEALLENIKRKIPAGRTVMVEDNKNVSKLISDVRDMKRDQDSMGSKLINLKRENEALWTEYASMRQKFTKQQQIIEKLIHFLIAMVKKPSKGIVPKRKFSHLALEGGEDNPAALSNINTIHKFLQSNVLGQSEANIGGAQIQEVTEDPDPSQDWSAGNPTENFNVNSAEEHVISSEIEPGTILNLAEEPGTILNLTEEPLEYVDVSTSEHINATNVVSPQGTLLMDSMTNHPLLDEDPLSPELLNTVDPSAVTQSFKYPVSSSDSVATSLVCSTADKSGAACGSSSLPPPPTPASSINTLIQTVTHKGKKKSLVAQKKPAEDTSMRIVVPEKNMNKHELQGHMDDMQNTIDNLQDFITNASLNVDPAMLHSMFGLDNHLLPDLDSMATVSSGNELSLYNPHLMDLADSIEEEGEDDPLSFLNTFASTSTTPQTSSSTSSFTPINSAVPSNKSTRPPPAKHLKVLIKKEPEVSQSLETPVVSPMTSASLFRGKRHAN